MLSEEIIVLFVECGYDANLDKYECDDILLSSQATLDSTKSSEKEIQQDS
jgi:hypothetical protein